MTGHVLDEIAPVRTDVANRGAGAALVRLEPPREVRGFEQPVLEVAAMHEMQRAQLAGGDHRSRLLHQGVAAIVERDCVHDAGPRRGIEQSTRFGSGHRQRLVRDDVFAMGRARP